MSQSSQGNGGSNQERTGELTRNAIKLLPTLTSRIVTEFRAEPCPDGQAVLRESVITALTEAVNMIVVDAAEVFEGLPAEAQVIFDKNVANLRVLETAEAVLSQVGPSMKQLAIAIIRILLPILPKSGRFGWIRLFLTVILTVLEALQENPGSSGLLI